MRILYISNWGINDPLTIASVMPTLLALKAQADVKGVTLVTVERKGSRHPKYDIPHGFVDHVGIAPKAQWSFLATKAYEVLVLPRLIERICRNRGTQLIFARCSPAGAVAYRIHARTGIPFIVESFEPHSEYMVNCGSWRQEGWKHRYSRLLERRQMRAATLLITVSRNYRDHLVAQEGVNPSRIAVVPCVTDLQQTKFDLRQRLAVRAELELGMATVAIYVGKFGDLYYDEEAFHVLRDAFDYFADFRLVLLTPTDPSHIQTRLRAAQIPIDRVQIKLVARHEIPAYLSAADFAYSFVRPHAASLYQCPVKNGEYWACGLPFIAADNVGDDCSVIAHEGGGANLDTTLTNVRQCHEAMARIMSRPDYREKVRELAVRYKGTDILDRALSTIFKRGGPVRELVS